MTAHPGHATVRDDGRTPAVTAAPAQPDDGPVGAAGTVAVIRRLPGKARPRMDVLREYQELNAERRSRIPAPLWPFWAPDPDEFYRWRVQLACGCVKEVLTTGPERRPDEAQWPDYRHGARLPAGQVFCFHEDAPPAPYREITVWGGRREQTFPADPEEPPAWASKETWAKVRHNEPHTCAFWNVTLSCGHAAEVAVSDPGWKPADGPDLVSASRLREIKADFEELWESQPDAEEPCEREHRRRMIAVGCPSPEPEELCWTCPRAQAITACQRTGWLVPRHTEPDPTKPPKQPSQASLQQRLREAEAQADELRRQLAQLEAPAEQQRGS